jgi:hypothetical protein
MWSRSVWVLALAGASAFWVANLAISLTPVAADYRAALSIPYVPMLVEAAIGGTAIGLFVSWILLRFPDRVPGKQPVAKVLLLCFAVLLMVTAVIEVPGKFLGSANRPLHYLLIATGINLLRILALGLVIGSLRLRAAGRDRKRTSGESPN